MENKVREAKFRLAENNKVHLEDSGKNTLYQGGDSQRLIALKYPSWNVIEQIIEERLGLCPCRVNEINKTQQM